MGNYYSVQGYVEDISIDKNNKTEISTLSDVSDVSEISTLSDVSEISTLSDVSEISTLSDVSDVSNKNDNYKKVSKIMVDEIIQKALYELGNPINYSSSKETQTDNNSDYNNSDYSNYDNYINYQLIEEDLIKVERKYETLAQKYEGVLTAIQIYQNKIVSLQKQNIKLKKESGDLSKKKLNLDNIIHNYKFKVFYLKDIIDEMKINYKIRKTIILEQIYNKSIKIIRRKSTTW